MSPLPSPLARLTEDPFIQFFPNDPSHACILRIDCVDVPCMQWTRHAPDIAEYVASMLQLAESQRVADEHSGMFHAVTVCQDAVTHMEDLERQTAAAGDEGWDWGKSVLEAYLALLWYYLATQAESYLEDAPLWGLAWNEQRQVTVAYLDSCRRSAACAAQLGQTWCSYDRDGNGGGDGESDCFVAMMQWLQLHAAIQLQHLQSIPSFPTQLPDDSVLLPHPQLHRLAETLQELLGPTHPVVRECQVFLCYAYAARDEIEVALSHVLPWLLDARVTVVLDVVVLLFRFAVRVAGPEQPAVDADIAYLLLEMLRVAIVDTPRNAPNLRDQMRFWICSRALCMELYHSGGSGDTAPLEAANACQDALAALTNKIVGGVTG